MQITKFDLERDLIIVPARIWGRSGSRMLSLVLDTGSASTVIAPQVVKDIGYDPRDRIALTTVRSALGKEHGYTLKIARFAALGFVFTDFEVNVFDLATGYDIDGLVGLSFLRNFDYEVRSIVGKISVRPAVTDPFSP